MKDHENLVSLNGSKVSIKEAKALLKDKHALFQATNAVANPTQSQKALAITRLKDKTEAQVAYFKIVTTAFSLFGVCWMEVPGSTGTTLIRKCTAMTPTRL